MYTIKTMKPSNKKQKAVTAPTCFKPIDEDYELVHKSEFHTLFIEEVPGEKIPVEDENGQYYDGIFQETDDFKIYKLHIGDFSEEANKLHPMFNTIAKADFEDCLEFHIDSDGGSVNEGKLFFNVMNNFDKENIAAFLNTGYSMGALLFCMPDIRIVHEFSDLMFHDYSSVLYGKAGNMETTHKHHTKHIRNFFKRFTLDKGFLTQDEFELMLVGKEFWMDTEEMCRRGIATHVKLQSGTISAESYLESLNPPEPVVETTVKKPRVPRKATKELKELMELEPIPEIAPSKITKTPRKKKEA
jgi:ATP-dependent protease ClpP protease subunit